MDISKNNLNNDQQTPDEYGFGLKLSKNDFSDSSLGENMFQNISTKTRSKDKNYLSKIKDKEKDSLCRKIDFSMEIESNDSKDILSEEKENTKNDNSNFSIKDESNNSIININNKKSLSSEEQMDVEEELDLRLIKKQSSKSICLTNSKFDEDYIIIKTLSKGENGNVYLCMKIQDNKTYVVKMSTSFTRKIDYFNLERIIKDISKNSENKFYPYIHKYNDCWIEEGVLNDENLKNYVKKKIIYMVSNYCPNGNLVEFIQKIKECNKDNKNINTVLNGEFYWDIIFQMMIALDFFHKVGYIHLDIKPTNFLVDSDGTLQLTDFSFCIKENEIDKLSTLYEYEGDSKYISPEMFYKQFNKVNHKTDIFSLGLSIYELLSQNNLPLNGDIWQKIRKEGFPIELYDKIPKFENNNDISQFIQLIKLMTYLEASDRPEIESILKNEVNFPSLNKRYKSMEKNSFCLSYDINKIPYFKCPKYEFSSNNISLKDLFIKRSDSMKNEFFVK